MAFLQDQIAQPRTVAHYQKQISFEFNVKYVYPIDQIEMHKQNGQMISSTLTNTTMSLSKLQVTLANTQSQLKIEKVSSLEKDTKIKYLEDLVLKMGYDPCSINFVEEIFKKKNAEVSALRKQLKFPASEDPMTKEIEEIEVQKSDMMKIIMEQNLRIKQMEEQMEKLVKDKEEAMKKENIPLDVVPLGAIPMTKVSTSGIALIIGTTKGVE